MPSDDAVSIDLNGTLAAADGRIYFYSHRNEPDGDAATPRLSSIDTTGHEQWHAPLPRAWIRTPPLVDSQGHIWILANDKKDLASPFNGAVAYRVSPDGVVLWEESLAGAPGDLEAAPRGLRTAAAAIDENDNLYFAIGHSAVSLSPNGSVRWAKLLLGGDRELPCEQWLPWYYPAVIGDRVVYAAACSNYIFDLNGKKVAQFDSGFGDMSEATIGLKQGWFTRPLPGRGVEARDSTGAVRATWPLAASQSSVFDRAGRLLAISESGFGAWSGDQTPWTYVPQWGQLYDWFSDDQGFVFIGQSAFSQITVLSSEGAVAFDAAVGRFTRRPPVAAKEGELVFISRSFDEAVTRTMLTCVRVPIGYPTATTWSRLNRDFRNSRLLK